MVSHRVEGVLGMWFAVLGPLHVADGNSTTVPVRSVMQRRLLAVLLSSPGRAASVDRLTDELWGDDPPRNPESNLQVHVHRLRRLIGEDRILFRPPGYALRVEPAELDTDVFEQLAGAGREALAGGDHTAAARHLADALELWRGMPYQEFDGSETVRREAERLAELRLGVLEDRLEADLAVGRHAVLVPELTALVAEHPLRERVRGLQMLALYRSGRPADALETYRAARQVAIDELGLEPGAELRRLEQSILTEDPELDSPDERRPATMPAELPAGSASFTGRRTEHADVMKALHGSGDGPAVVAISGPGGVGKSALALEVANAVAADFPDGQLYVNLHGATPGMQRLSAAEALGRCLRSLGVEDRQVPEDAEEAAARFRSVVADRRLLIVLDDAADVTQVRPLMPGAASRAGVLVTSRPALTSLDGTTLFRLGALPADQAVELLARLAGPDRVDADPDAAAEVGRLCARVPLALRIAAARLAARPDWSLAGFAERLGDARARLDELEHADLAVRTCYAVSHDALPAEVAELFAAIGLLDLSDLSVPVLTALSGRRPAVLRRQLDTLVEAQLIEGRPGDRYAIHDLLRLYAREQAGRLDPEARIAGVRRVVHQALATTREASVRLNPESVARLGVGLPDTELVEPGIGFDDAAAASRWAIAGADDLVALTGHARDLPDDGPAATIGLAAAAAVPFASQGAWARLRQINLIALDAASRADVPEVAGLTAWRDLAATCFEMGRLDEAHRHAERGLAAARAHGDVITEARTLNLLGSLYGEQGQYEEAATAYRGALEIDRRCGDHTGVLATQVNLGDLAFKLGRKAEAKQLWEDCLAAHRELGDSNSKAIVLGCLGLWYDDAGEPQPALDYFEQARQLNLELSYRHEAMVWTWHCSIALAQLDRTAEALDLRRQALDYLVSTGELTTAETAGLLAEQTPACPAALVLR